LDIDPVHFLSVRNPNTIVCGDVKHGLAIPHGTLERLRFGEITRNNLTIDTGQIATVAVWTDERADIVTGCY
jgi:hypothetical protein